MQINAQVLALKPVKGISAKTNKPYSFHTLSVIDTHSDEPEILKINVNDDQAAAASGLVGKTVAINAQFARGNFSLITSGK